MRILNFINTESKKSSSSWFHGDFKNLNMQCIIKYILRIKGSLKKSTNFFKDFFDSIKNTLNINFCIYTHNTFSFSTLREALTILKALYRQTTPYSHSDWLWTSCSCSWLVPAFPLNVLHLYFVNFCAFIELRCESSYRSARPAAISARQDTQLYLNKWQTHHQIALSSNERTVSALKLDEVWTSTVGQRFPVVQPALLCSWLLFVLIPNLS